MNIQSTYLQDYDASPTPYDLNMLSHAAASHRDPSNGVCSPDKLARLECAQHAALLLKDTDFRRRGALMSGCGTDVAFVVDPDARTAGVVGFVFAGPLLVA